MKTQNSEDVVKAPARGHREGLLQEYRKNLSISDVDRAQPRRTARERAAADSTLATQRRFASVLLKVGRSGAGGE